MNFYSFAVPSLPCNFSVSELADQRIHSRLRTEVVPKLHHKNSCFLAISTVIRDKEGETISSPSDLFSAGYVCQLDFSHKQSLSGRRNNPHEKVITRTSLNAFTGRYNAVNGT